MKIADKPPSDIDRVRALRQLNLLDSAPEEAFDALTRMAAEILDVPIALISLVDESRQWFKSSVGLEAIETPRDVAFCAHTILEKDALVISDALKDERFRDNPLVIDGPCIRAYVGVPLFSMEGHPLGTLCAIDRQPRQFAERDLRFLRNLAGMAQREIHARECALNAHALAQQALQELERRKAVYRAIFDGAAVGIALVDKEGNWQLANQRLAEILGRPQDELVRMNFREVTHPDDIPSDLSLRENVLSGKLPHARREKRYIRPDGSIVHANVGASPSLDAYGMPNGLILVIEDITARREAERALDELRQQLERRVEERTEELAQVNRQQLLMLDNDLVGIVKLRGRKALWHNKAFTHIFGGIDNEAVGRSAREVYTSDEIFERIGREAYQVLAVGGTYRTQVPMRHKSGALLWIDLSGALLSAETKESIWMLLDITQMKVRHDEVASLAFHDALTGLANRALLHERLEQAIASATRTSCRVALCFLDLDGFKGINDTLGHEAGDEVLQAVAARMLGNVRSNDTVARLGGDEFVMLLTQLSSREEVAPILARTKEDIARSIALKNGGTTRVSASVGVAFYPDQTLNADGLILEADRAMYVAKREHRRTLIDSADSEMGGL